MKESLVSVIIPTYSRPTHLIRAIESVLCQTYHPIEIIVVDDNGVGTDYQKESEKLLSPYIISKQITYIKHEINKNGSAARNTGFKHCHGKYVIFFDDDDEMLPDKIQKQVFVLQSSSSNVCASYTGLYIYKRGKLITEKHARRDGNMKLELLSGMWGFGSGSNLLFKYEAVKKVGGYDESFKRHQDWEFVVRFFRYYEVAAIDEPLLIKHNDGVSHKFTPQERLIFMESFLYKFQPDIESYPTRIQKTIYHRRYFDVAIIAATASEYRFMIKVLKKVSSYGGLTLKECLRLCKHLFFKPLKRS